jgi:hypothetical protein
MGYARRGALAAVLVGVLALLTASAGASPGGGGCQLNGNASFDNGLGSTSKAFTYSFTGDLTGCQSTDAGAPATGRVQAGGIYTLGGVAYQLAQSTGTGGCSNSTTAGVAITDWADGTRTLIKYSTTGAAAAVALSGTVLPSLVLHPVDTTLPDQTVTTTRYAGASPSGALAFEANPPDCLSAAGVTNAGIAGSIGLTHS